MGIHVRDIGGCLSRHITVLRDLDNGVFVIQLGTDWSAPLALIGLGRATRVILNHDDEKWYVHVEDGWGAVAYTGVCKLRGSAK